MPGNSETIGRAIHIQGVVQGVGFRPFVYGLAVRHGLGGWVLNSSAGVDIQVFGGSASVDDFVRELEQEKPPLAAIDQIDVLPIPLPTLTADRAENGSHTFVIRESTDRSQAFVPVSPDVATCDDCLRELFDPNDRRYRYSFINCTNCGPRFTIVRDIPYDRLLTTMAPFEMCPSCQAEYNDPANRRFHAQPNACPVCGPHLSLVPSTSFTGLNDLSLNSPLQSDAALVTARRLLDEGRIVAIKGLGGYHLACNAVDDKAVDTLRERKGRVDKPFAVMAPDLDAVCSFALVSDAEADLLLSRQRPIVLLRKRADFWLSDQVAPGNHMIGVMLPYTPLHHLLLHNASRELWPDKRCPVYVMTSGNLSEEPIVKDDQDAQTRLAPLADAFLQHDRKIHIHCDDSVVRAFRGSTISIRRARGFAPFPVRLPMEVSPALAVGGELKNTFCLTNGRYAFMSQHIGDMENLETLHAFEGAVEHYRNIFRVSPQRVACDMHPRYLSTRWATDYARRHDLPLVTVQHHHAHIAAVMAEHGLTAEDRAIGVALDGTGYGLDGTIWGAEILVGGYAEFERVGRLRPVPLPGGDAAIRRPYRTALAYLWDAGIEWDDSLPPVQAAIPEEQRILRRQLETGLNATPASSMGRFFDAIASIAGVRQVISYEAQAAMEFEALAGEFDSDPYLTGGLLVSAPVGVQNDSAPSLHSAAGELQFDLDPRPIVRQVVEDVGRGVAPAIISARFHAAVAGLVRDACVRVRESSGLDRVALSGGVFQNLRLLELVLDSLEAAGFAVLMHRRIPANDGGIALGQALVAHFNNID